MAQLPAPELDQGEQTSWPHVRRQPSTATWSTRARRASPTTGSTRRQGHPKQIKWSAPPRLQGLRRADHRRRQDLHRHQQPGPARPEACDRRQGHRHVLRRGRRQVPLAGGPRQAGRPAGSTTGRARASAPAPSSRATASTTSATAARSSAPTPTASTTARTRWRDRREVQATRHGRRHRLEARHDQGPGRLPAQPGHLLAADRRRHPVRHHQQRRGRGPHQHPQPRGPELPGHRQEDRQGPVVEQPAQRKQACKRRRKT